MDPTRPASRRVFPKLRRSSTQARSPRRRPPAEPPCGSGQGRARSSLEQDATARLHESSTRAHESCAGCAESARSSFSYAYAMEPQPRGSIPSVTVVMSVARRDAPFSSFSSRVAAPNPNGARRLPGFQHHLRHNHVCRGAVVPHWCPTKRSSSRFLAQWDEVLERRERVRLGERFIDGIRYRSRDTLNDRRGALTRSPSVT